MMCTLGNTACSLALLAALFPAALAAQDETPPPGEDTPVPVEAPADEASKPAPMTPPTLAAVIEQLSAESQKAFAELLAADWKKRPEWGDMLISLLKGEDMAPGVGWFR